MAKHYKDSLFRSLFSDEDELRDLYNALKGTHYGKNTPITINTLTETLFVGGKNDISFSIDGKLVVLIEHQSTLNKNMPFRCLSPVVRLFENGITDKDAVYQQKLIRLQRPEFLVLCNSPDVFPDFQVLRLSDSFLPVAGNTEINLELKVTVYNINKGHNAALLAKHPTLHGYAFFVDQVRQYQVEEAARDPLGKRQDILNRAIVRAIEACKEQGILVEYWEHLNMEDKVMLAREWNLEDALAVRFREGQQEGRQEEREEIARNALAEGIPLELICKISGMEKAAIKSLAKKLGNKRRR
jgi:predicted transposase YdaD